MTSESEIPDTNTTENSSSDRLTQRVAGLLLRMMLGEATPAEHREFEELLASDPAARQTYYHLLDVDQGLMELGEFGASLPPQSTVILPAQPARKRPWRRLSSRGMRYLAVAMFSVVATIGVSRLLATSQPVVAAANRQRIVMQDAAPAFVATFIRSTNCVWASDTATLMEGQRLLSGNMKLKSGLAEFRFDSGVRLVLEGPARLRIVSAQCAHLDAGKVVLHGHEMADEFALVTPRGTLFDVGTEYGTFVDDDGDVELHVFDGQVRIESAMVPPAESLVEAGDAKRLGTAQVESLSLNPEEFQRETPGRSAGGDPAQGGLLAYDGFTCSGPENDWHTGGFGWSGAWLHHIGSPKLSTVLSDPQASIEFESRRQDDRTGLIRLAPKKELAKRSLAHPLRLNMDNVYYLSFSLRKVENVAPNVPQYASVSFRSSIAGEERRRIVVGMSSERLPILSHNDQNLQVAPPLMVGESYLFVVKIVAGSSTPDQILLRIYSKEEPPQASEPSAWTVMTRPDFDHTEYDHVMIYSQGTTYEVDEVRLATTWEAATSSATPQPPLEQ